MSFDFFSLAQTLKELAILASVVVIGYAGLKLMTSTSAFQRDEWKEIVAGVIFGLVLLFLAPLIAQQLGGATYCR